MAERKYIESDKDATPAHPKDSEAYTQLIDSIKRRMDPTSNTVLIVDDE